MLTKLLSRRACHAKAHGYTARYFLHGCISYGSPLAHDQLDPFSGSLSNVRTSQIVALVRIVFPTPFRSCLHSLLYLSNYDYICAIWRESNKKISRKEMVALCNLH